jgi:choline kinase
VENADWERNNILASLFYAERYMDDGFVCTYADILYRPFAVERLMASRHDATLVVDTDFRARYRHRSQHPETDAEKVRCEGERVVEVRRSIPGEEASGEYIGVAKFTPAGAAALREHYHRVLDAIGPESPFQGAATYRQAYLIHLFQELLERGAALHRVDTHGEYHEIDTTEDYALAQRQWQ